MAEETQPSCGSVQPADSTAVPVKASMDSISDPEINAPEIPPVTKTEVALRAFCVLCLTYYLSSAFICSSIIEDTSNDVRLRIIWGLAQLVVLAVAASPVPEDRGIDHGKIYFVYQAIVIGAILSSPRPPDTLFHLCFTFVYSSHIFDFAISFYYDDYARTGTYGLFMLCLQERLYGSLGASEETLSMLKVKMQNRIHMNRSTTDELLTKEKSSRSESVSVEDIV
ncbi:hypothetical protein BDZ89DRAFT_1138549 [Hymenopellis radicata]|nr:hypothetical protein BDZ89DRAFT_1138549 [Hymenopellis radicata]